MQSFFQYILSATLNRQSIIQVLIVTLNNQLLVYLSLIYYPINRMKPPVTPQSDSKYIKDCYQEEHYRYDFVIDFQEDSSISSSDQQLPFSAIIIENTVTQKISSIQIPENQTLSDDEFIWLSSIEEKPPKQTVPLYNQILDKKAKKNRKAIEKKYKKLESKCSKEITTFAPLSNSPICPINFKRSHMLQELISQKNRESKLIKFILQKSLNIEQALDSLESRSRVVPESFTSNLEYQQRFGILHQMQTIFTILQQIKKVKDDSTKNQCYSIILNSQSRRVDGLYEISALQNFTDDSRSIKENISKYKLMLLIPQDHGHSQLVQVIEPFRKKIKQQIILLSSSGFQKYPLVYNLYDLCKITTEVRDFEAILNLKHSPLANLIYNPSAPSIPSKNCYRFSNLNRLIEGLLKYYNSAQFQSIKMIANLQQGISLLQGPPGTGKTSTLIGILSCQYSKLVDFNKNSTNLNTKVLVCTPSNEAADHIGERIIQQGLFGFNGDKIWPKVLRVGMTESKNIESISLFRITKKLYELQKKQQKMRRNQLDQRIKALDSDINQLVQNDKFHHICCFKKIEKTTYESLLSKSQDNGIELKSIIGKLEKSLISGSQILITTLTTSFSEKIMNTNPTFSCLIIDEAAQATEPNTLIPLQYGVSKLVLIGDHKQLPPTTLHPSSKSTKYNRSLFERFLDSKIEPLFLEIQYRMSPLIREFPNIYFYQNKLKDGAEILQSSSSISFLKTKPVVFIACPGSNQKDMGKSYCNVKEAKILSSLLDILLLQSQLTVGVITPYQGQCQVIKRLRKFQDDSLNSFKISTIDAYQGQQKDIILISMVRSNASRSLGFIDDLKRINVALTRAKKALFVIGDPTTLSKSQFWRQYLQWVKIKGTYIKYEMIEDHRQIKIENIFDKSITSCCQRSQTQK